ncbi:amine oxidoreductase [Betaproteobacteria bacterium]|nr:amine oxidoreductase [Betaproteobacteria bacterium]
MSTRSHVAIIGGGWAGLACAVELSAAGVPVCVFEAAKQLGGRARRVEFEQFEGIEGIEGHAFDNGQHLLIGAYHETLRIMRQCDADPERLLQRRSLELDYPRQGFRIRLPRLPAPFHLALGLLTARGCPPREKWVAVRFIRALQASNYQLTDDISVAELLDRHRQRENLRRFLWEPLCLAALNTPPERASAQIFANVLREVLDGTRENSDLLLPQTDLSQIFPDPAARFITARGGEIRLSARVECIECCEQSLAINGERFEQAVIAAAPQHASSLLRHHAETRDIAALLDVYPFEPIGTVYLAYPESLRLSFPMLGMSGPLGQWVFDRSSQQPESANIVGCVLSAQGAWDERDNDSLATALHDELQQTLGRPLPEPNGYRVIRERRATFSCRPGLPRPPAKTALRGLWLAGDYVCAEYPATLEGAVRSGCRVARGILGEEESEG